MSFKLQFSENSKTGLVALCDVCGKRVDGDSANILWLPKDNEKPGDTFPFIIVCAGECDRRMEEKSHYYSQNLATAIVFLARNCDVDWKRANRNADILQNLL